MKKFLFLDIDGVLNSGDWTLSDEAQALRRIAVADKVRDNRYWFDPVTIELLTDIVLATDCDIVISSSWRKNKTVEELQDLLTEVGFKYADKIVGKTDSSFSWLKPGIHCPSIRGLEIRVWLETNVKMVNPAYQFEYTYCILDDDSDMLLEQKNNFVNTDPQVGLTADDASKVIRILNTMEI